MGADSLPQAPERGFSLVELVVVVVVVSIISAVLLDRIKFYQVKAEKTAMEATAAAIRAALHMRMAAYLAHGREQDLPRLASGNPMELLATTPENYAGAFDRAGAESVPEGNWYLDLSNQTLVYKVRYGQGFVPDSNGRKEVRFRAVVEYGLLEDPVLPALKGIKIVDFSPVTTYTWNAED
jgi:prepilin-type N-terminal cleavage/methylation domain-containing protein